MIPIAPPQSYSSSRYATMNPSFYVPPAVLFHRQLGPPRKRIRYTSQDELCAASVLISLTPREDSPILQMQVQPPQRAHPPPPPPREALGPIPSRPQHRHHQPPKFLPCLVETTPNRWAEPPRTLHRHYSPPASNINMEQKKLSSSARPVLPPPGTGHVTDSSSYTSATRTLSFDSTVSGGSSSPTTIVEAGGGTATSCWFDGSTSLALPEDEDVLSPLHCFMRRYCVEAFSASQDDVSTPRYGKSHGIKVVVGQVGIRCLYCKHQPPGKRPERAVCYPSSLQNIYHSIETWQRRHSLVCSHIPPWVRKSIVELMESSKSRAGGRRQYWESAAKRLGMVDTSHGVRFARIPGYLGPEPDSPSTSNDDADSHPVVQEEDRELVTPYLFLLLDQMQTCHFTEEDRTGGRSKIKDNTIGFPGMQCKHCHGKAGFGRYFPTSASALALANSDRNIYNHIKKCRRCPIQVKAELRRLSQEVSNGKNRRGARKLFFNRVWERIHHEAADSNSCE